MNNPLRDIIPAKWRKRVYATFAALVTVETALDLVGWGLVPTDIQAKVIVVAGALGWVAASNTRV